MLMKLSGFAEREVSRTYGRVYFKIVQYLERPQQSQSQIVKKKKNTDVPFFKREHVEISSIIIFFLVMKHEIKWHNLTADVICTACKN